MVSMAQPAFCGTSTFWCAIGRVQVLECESLNGGPCSHRIPRVTSRLARLPRQTWETQTPAPPRRDRCIGYSYTTNSEVWRFRRDSKSASVRPSGPLRVNNGDAMMPAQASVYCRNFSYARHSTPTGSSDYCPIGLFHSALSTG